MQEKHQQVNRVLFITLIFNLIVSISKIILGTLTGALAITADGFHSMADSASNVIALVANTIAGRPPDDDHPYGHARFETLATLGIGLLLLLTAWETIQGVIERVFQNEVPELTPVAFLVMIFTLIINVFVNRYQVAAGKRLNSELLLADAAHTGTDILVTLSVLLSMFITITLGWAWVDIVTALLVVALIVHTSWKIVGQTGRVLVDTAPVSLEVLQDIILQIPSVKDVVRVRSRGSIDAVHIDADVMVDRIMTTEQTSAIKSEIEDTLHKELENIVEVEVHFVMNPEEPADVAQTVRAVADTLNLKTHNVYLSEIDGKQVLDMHVEVPTGQPLWSAHQQVSELEDEIAQRFPDIERIDSHIEPIPENISLDEPIITINSPHLESHILRLLGDKFAGVDWHDVQLLTYGSSYNVSIHVTLPSEMSIDDAHLFAENAERFLRTELSDLDRITIHTEPENVTD